MADWWTPDVAGVAAAFARVGETVDDDGKTELPRDLPPAYFADYWGREEEFRPPRAGLRAWHASDLGVEPEPFDVRLELARTTVPALVVVGEHDFIRGPRRAERLRAAIPHAQVLELADSGHFGHFEQPDEFLTAVAEFVAKAAQ